MTCRSCGRQSKSRVNGVPITLSFGLRILTAVFIGSPGGARSRKTISVGPGGWPASILKSASARLSKPDSWLSMRAWKRVSPIAPVSLPRPLPNWRKRNVGFTFSSMRSRNTRSSCSTPRATSSVGIPEPSASRGTHLPKPSVSTSRASIPKTTAERECLGRRSQQQSGPESTKLRVAAALRAASRAAMLTHRLLAFARRQPLTPEVLSANKLVAGISELLRRTLGESILIETVLAGGLWPTLADGNQLENALINLAINARDAMPEGGKLTIETANTHLDPAYARMHDEVQPGQYVGIFVTDTGIGMTPETVAHAFEPFFTTKEIGQGTGLGLSQVYGFIKQSGGHVKIYSEVGLGTTVKLYLPRYRGTEQAVDEKLETHQLPRGRSELVLVVEDDPEVRVD